MDISRLLAGPSAHVAWWEGAGGAIVGGLLGALLGGYIPLLTAKRARFVERAGEIEAMFAELHLAHISINALRNDKIAAPLYRLPLTMFERAIPKLIGEGLLSARHISGLIEYVTRAEELNRGLQSAANAAAARDDNRMFVEFDRNKTKATDILEKKEERLYGNTLFEVTWDALFAAQDATLTARIKRIAMLGAKPKHRYRR